MRKCNEESIDNLFANKSFLEAIGKKDADTVKSFISKTCKIHLDENLASPYLKFCKEKQPDRYEKLKQLEIETFNKKVAKLTEIIFESLIGNWPDQKIDSEYLIFAIREEYGDIVQFYFSIGGPTFQWHRYDQIDFVGLNEDELEFFKLAKKGDANSMLDRIKNGINLHAKTEDLTTPLMVAVEYGNHDAAEMLLKFKADIHARETVDAECTGEGVTAMNLAALNKDFKMINLLLAYGGDINEKAGFDGESPFLIAIHSGDYDYMDFILQKGADINIELYNGKTGLVHAVLTDNKKLTNYLLENGADINHRNITGWTALEFARSLNRTEMVDYLIQSGASGEYRMLEHLVTYRQDLCACDNDVAYAYYHWDTDDGFSHFLIYGIGYLNKYLALSELRRFYIRKKDEECIETFAGDDHNWFHYVREENGKVVDEKNDLMGLNALSYNRYQDVNNLRYKLSDYYFEPEKSDEFDFEDKFQKLSDYFFQYVSIVKKNIESEISSVKMTYRFSRYSEKGWNFLGPYWGRTSVNVNEEHEKLITDFLVGYFIF